MTGQTVQASPDLDAALAAAETVLAEAERELAAVEVRVRRRDPSADQAVLRHAMLRAEGAEQERDRLQSAVAGRRVDALLDEARDMAPAWDGEVAELRRAAQDAVVDLARRLEGRNVWARDLLAQLRAEGWSPTPPIPRSIHSEAVGGRDLSPSVGVVSTRAVLRDLVDAAANAAGVTAEQQR